MNKYSLHNRRETARLFDYDHFHGDAKVSALG